MTGAELIQQARKRHAEVEGWTPEHYPDHDKQELVLAAIAYAAIDVPSHRLWGIHGFCRGMWPWDWKWWKPNPDPVRNLVKAGALIAAEIDRLQALEETAKRLRKEIGE